MKVLIPLDASKFAEEVLDYAAKLVKETSSEVHLVTVVPETAAHMTFKHEYVPENVSFRGAEPMGITRPSIVTSEVPVGVVESKDAAMERTIYSMKDYLWDVAGQFRGQKVKTAVLVESDVADAIQNYAQKNQIDLIMLASHGRTGLAHVIMGSVAMELLRSGRTPMLLVRPNGLRD